MLNQVPRVPKYLSAQMPEALKCLSVLSIQVSLECPWSALGVLFEGSSALWVSLECSLSANWVEKVSNITENGLLNSFKDIKNMFQYMY